MPSTSVAIYNNKIGPRQAVFIIAEAGSNHNGDLDTALQLIEAAGDAGANAVKFQTFEAARIYPKSAGTSDYLGVDTPIYDIIEAMQMPPEWLPQLRDAAHDRGLAFLSSPFHEEAVQLLAPFVDAYKIASYELTHAPLMAAIAAAGKPVLLSTGASTLAETREAVDRLRRHGCTELVVLQCTAAYPTPPEFANVRAVATLARELGVLAGLSDHTRDPTIAPMAAVSLGAVVIEKHFTLSNDLPGPDHAFAVEPDELALLVESVRRTETVLGSGEKLVLPVEQELRHFARRSIFSIRSIRKGERFTRANVDVLRHGKLATGLAPDQLDRVLASVAARPIDAETALDDADLAPAEPQPKADGITLRPAAPADRDVIFAWANDPQTRAASFNPMPITRAEHEAWYEKSLGGARTLYVAELNGVPIGSVRLDRGDRASAVVSLTIAPEHRGQGKAVAVLRALAKIAAEAGLRKLTALIRRTNEPSRKTFERAGYGLVAEESVAGTEAARYVLALETL